MQPEQRAKLAVAAEFNAKPSERQATRPLTPAEKQTVVATFCMLLEGLYAHLPQKRATYGQDPVQRLRALQQRLDGMEDTEFHRTMAEIVTELRDAHTRYLGPSAIQGRIAALPFLIERYVKDGVDRYIVSKIFTGEPSQMEYFASRGFVPGVELTHWNGIGIDRAIDLYAARETGGRPDARRARALESLTLRPLRYALPPDEDWVDLSFVGTAGEQTVRLEWGYVDMHDLPKASDACGMAEQAYAVDPLAEASRRVKKMLFSPLAWYRSQQLSGATRYATEATVCPDDFSDAVSADTYTAADGTVYGYLRLWSFDLVDDDGFLAHVITLLAHLPRTGLIIDLRGNPGGLIWAAERLLQLFTPNPIEPVRFSMLASDISRDLAHAPQNRISLAPWRSSLETAVISGEQHSRALPLTPPERCNDIGQRYPGPVVAVVDANTYSSGDLFAAGFVDNKVGTLVSLDQATGAGGANVWRSQQVSLALSGTQGAPSRLPGGIAYTLAFRRAIRVGDSAGIGIEDRGISGHLHYAPTLRDLREGNPDLKAFCGRLLACETLTDLDWGYADGTLRATTLNLDRIELYVDDRPYGAPTRIDATTLMPVVYKVGNEWSKLEVVGFSGDLRRQRRLLRPDSV